MFGANPYIDEGQSFWGMHEKGHIPAGTFGGGTKAAAAFIDQANLVLTPGQRALHMLTDTERYLPGKVRDYFGSGPLGKYVAQSFGWSFAGGGPGGDDFTKMGKSLGFLGSKAIKEQGWNAFKDVGFGLGVAGSVFSLYVTADYMSEGWNENGFTGAAQGLGMAMAEEYAGRAILPKVAATNLAGMKKGWAMGRGLMAGYAAAGGAAGGAAATAGVGLGILGGAVVGAAATLINPYAWAIAGGIYAYDQISGEIDAVNRGNARLRQVEALEMGSPILDQYGSISTLRQRSLAALQNSHVNGRMALGNEAALLH